MLKRYEEAIDKYHSEGYALGYARYMVLEEASADVERLVKALQNVLDSDSSGYRLAARAALAPFEGEEVES